MKKFIGKIVVAVVKALMRGFLGMFIGIVFVGLIIIVLLFFDVLVPDLQSEGMVSELVSLLFIGGGIGAVVGFFDMIDFNTKPSLHSKNIKVEPGGSSSWHNTDERHP